MAAKVLSFGLLALFITDVAGGIYLYLKQGPDWQFCGRPIHQATFYRLVRKNGRAIDVCCPCCRLRFQGDRRSVAQALAANFESARRLAADQAYVIENSAVQLCCAGPLSARIRLQSASLPQGTGTVAFPVWRLSRTGTEPSALKKEFGGVLRTYDQLLSEAN